MDLTSEQRRAVKTIDRNLQVIACAGSGKTRVVAARVIEILRCKASEGIGAGNIVAFTFTERAAAELKDRISRFYEAEFGNVQGIAGMYVGTIHAFCLDLLHQYVPEYLKYDVLSDVTQQLLVDRYYERAGMKGLGLRRWVESQLYARVLGVLREADVDASALRHHPVVEAYAAYEGVLEDRHYLDFDEILVRAVAELADNDEVRRQVAERVRYVTVDEYQDLNPVQERLVRYLHELGANVCVVGDDDQNIYQWRGSDVQYILGFEGAYPGVVTVRLEDNFRSSSAVVDVARRAVEVNENRLDKAMGSTGAQGFERGDLLCLQFDNPGVEAAWIAGKIQAMRGLPYQEHDGRVRGLSWSDCAVLLRSVRNCAGPLVEELRASGIPYVVTGMSGLFGTPEAEAAAGVFQYMVQAIDAAELERRWEVANLGVEPAKLQRGIRALTKRREFRQGNQWSVYSLQRTYLGFLDAIELREEKVPGGRGELVLYNLGKFSQAISDYEEIHFRSEPESKYAGFVGFLEHQAPHFYAEGGQDVAYATPDAVQIMTVHQAKGLEFPVVFLPCMQRNRFPAKKQANRVWKYLPREAVPNADRYDGSVEDERRLFYVAVTRSEKYLFATWAPTADNQLYRRPSAFWDELTSREQVLTREPARGRPERLEPEPRRRLVNVELSFSDLKVFFECPYQFKLRLLYGFNAPIHEALGYGRSLHNALAEVHRRALAGERADGFRVDELVDRHLSLRYAYDSLVETLRRSAGEAVGRYLREHGGELDRLEHAEADVELALPDGVLVRGRIDLIKRTDVDETVIVDFKSTERAQAEDVTSLQLHLYALGYQQRFGRNADLLEVHNLDEGGSRRELVDEGMIGETLDVVQRAATQLRGGRLERHGTWCGHCETCDVAGLCRTRPAAAGGGGER